MTERIRGGVATLELQEQKQQAPLAAITLQRAKFLWWGLLLLAFLKTTGVLSVPNMPGFEPDPSWPYGLNQAAAQGLTFGREILFTYGPYASVFTQCYHPATVWRMAFGTLLLDGLYVGCFAVLAKSARLRWPFILGCILLLPTLERDVFFFSIPLLVSLVVLKSRLSGSAEAPEKNSPMVLLVLAFGCLGMLPLVKGTFLPLTAAMCAASSLFLLVNGKRLQAILCLVAPLVSMVLFWIAVGQPFGALPGYFMNMRSAISGYSEAMALQGPPLPWAALLAAIFFGAAVALLLTISVKQTLQRDEKILLLFVYALFFFIAFKEGAVRQDVGHIRVALSAVMLGSLLLPLLNRDGVRSFDPGKWLIVAVVSNALIALPMYASAVTQVRQEGAQKWISDQLQLAVWGSGENSWQRRFEQNQRVINAQSKLEFPMTGTVDMYADFDMDSLFCKGYRWNPRPSIVSYAAYMPEQIRLNEQHLRGAAAPDDLVIRLEPLDDHPPALEDGLSWPAMIDNYNLTGDDHGWIRLTRKIAIRKASRYASLGTVTAHLGEAVRVPAPSRPIFVTIDESTSPWGKALALAYKPPSLILTVNTESGTSLTYRVSSGMISSGFFLSPLVQDNEDFARLFDPKSPTRPDETVESISLDVFHGRRAAWNDSYTIHFQQYEY